MLVNIKLHSLSRLRMKDMDIVRTALVRAVRYFWLPVTVLRPHSLTNLSNVLLCCYFSWCVSKSMVQTLLIPKLFFP